MSVDAKKVLAEMRQAVKDKLGVLPRHEDYHNAASAVTEGLSAGIKYNIPEIQNAVEKLVKSLDDKNVTIGGDTMTEPLFGSLRTGILNELYEAENDYLARIKEKDAHIEELEKELAEQKEKAKVVVQLDANSISEIVHKAISEVAGEKDQPTPGFIVYDGKTYRKTNRDPQVGDVVIITEFDSEEGTWIRRVSRQSPTFIEDFYLDKDIDGSDFMDHDDDKIAAVYAPFDEGTTYA